MRKRGLKGRPQSPLLWRPFRPRSAGKSIHRAEALCFVRAALSGRGLDRMRLTGLKPCDLYVRPCRPRKMAKLQEPGFVLATQSKRRRAVRGGNGASLSPFTSPTPSPPTERVHIRHNPSCSLPCIFGGTRRRHSGRRRGVFPCPRNTTLHRFAPATFSH